MIADFLIGAVLGGEGNGSTPDTARIALAVFVPLLVLGLAVDVALFLRWWGRPVRWSERARRLQFRPWTLADVGLFALILMAALWGSGFILRDLPSMRVMLIQGFTLHGLVLMAVTALLVRRSVSVRQAFGVRRKKFRNDVFAGLVAYTAVFPFFVAVAMLAHLFLRRMGYPLEPQPVVALFAQDLPWGVRLAWLLLAVAAAPLAEEVLFRGVGQVALARRWGMPVAVGAVSLVFAVLHGHVPALVPLFVMGTAFSLAYIYTGSLITAITMHVVFNGVNLAVLHGVL